MPIDCKWSHWQEWSLESIPSGGRQSGDFVNRAVNLIKMVMFFVVYCWYDM